MVKIECSHPYPFLKCFEVALGLKVNIAKSCLFGVGVPNSDVETVAFSPGCSHDTIPFMYLGLPMGSQMGSVSTSSWRAMDELNHLLNILCNLELRLGSHEICSWIGDASGIFKSQHLCLECIPKEISYAFQSRFEWFLFVPAFVLFVAVDPSICSIDSLDHATR
nr:arginine repressor C-terminal-like domain-containing protein [Tanacetum cinerariifolium]